MSVTEIWTLLSGALGDRYALDRVLGEGGMGTVFLARDAEQQRPVAIKVMHPRLASAVDTQRFLREIDVLRGMTHPLIVPVYGSGDAAGLIYYIMPFIEGGSLYERLERERRVPVAEALEITRDVAEALGYAHARGVMHRDVKPENILFGRGRALVVDFGLARAIASAEYHRLTATGVIVGTYFYMSPEQLREEPDLDQRADIYGLGCVLYEMLTGEPPYTATSLKDLVTRILRSPIPSAEKLNPEVPPAVDRALARALAKKPADRFATMEEFAGALKG